jgi:hypothetical protein
MIDVDACLNWDSRSDLSAGIDLTLLGYAHITMFFLWLRFLSLTEVFINLTEISLTLIVVFPCFFPPL